MHNLRHFFNEVEPYLLVGFLGLVALFGLLKDWREYGKELGRFKTAFRIMVLFATIVVVVLSVYDTYSTRTDARSKEQAAERKETENKTRIENTDRPSSP